MDKFIITVSGLILAYGIYWFFFGKRETAKAVSGTLRITVSGGYKPDIIQVQKDKPVTLIFHRTDENSCLEEVVFPDYKIKKFLPLGEAVSLTLPPPHHVSNFHCSMNMFHGHIEVI